MKQVDGFRFLRALHSEFLKAQLNVIGSFTVKSLDTYHFLHEVISFEFVEFSQCGLKDRLNLAVQGKTTRGRGRRSDFRGRDRGGGHLRGRKEVIYCYYCKELCYTPIIAREATTTTISVGSCCH